MYTPKDYEYIIENYKTKTAEEIAVHLGKNVFSIRNNIWRLQRNGLIISKKGTVTKVKPKTTIRFYYKPIKFTTQELTVPGFEVGTKVKAEVGAIGFGVAPKIKKGIITFKSPYFIEVDFGVYRQSYLWHYVKQGKVVRI